MASLTYDEWVIKRTCLDKVPMGQKAALDVVSRAPELRAYRCPMRAAGRRSTHWHVTSVISLDGLKRKYRID